MKKERIIRGLLIPMNPNGTVILGAFTTLWGLWLISPFWRVFDSAPLFSKVREFAPEWAWGGWSVACGLILVVSLRNNNRRLTSFALGFHTWHWFVISGLLWWGDWRNTGGLTYMFIGLYALWAYLNFRINFSAEKPWWWLKYTKIGKLHL